MAEFKGTKGKWDIFSVTTNSYGVEHSNVGSKEDGVFIEVFTDEHKANALLISKAPEMLEILEEFVTHHFDFMGCAEIKELQEDAKILIKKATKS